MKKRILSLLLSLVMVLSLLPTTAWAWGGHGTTQHATNLAWNYATITENNNGGFTAREANVPSGATITVKVDNTELTKSSGRYSMANVTASDTTPVTISVSQGFYIVRVLLCCNDNNGYSCKTSQSEQAFSKMGSVDGTAVTMTLGEIWSHSTHNDMYFNPYWLMVMVAPVPQPVYVGYDAGTLNFTDTLVSHADGTWVSGVDTRKYTTNDGTVSHTVLDITSEAKAAAAAQGLEFDGWKLTYYNNYTENGNAFSNALEQYTDISKSVGNSITLFTHAKLVAQWKTRTTPATGTLTVTKTVFGLTDATKEFSFTVTNADGTAVEDGTFKLKNGERNTLTLTPGTYTVTESGADVTGYTLSTTGTGDVDVAAGQTANVTVTNTYTQNKVSVDVEKQWENVDGITLPESITVKLYKNGEATGNTLTLNAANQWKDTFADLPEYDGYTKNVYTVQEVGVPEGFTSSVNGYIVTNTAQWTAEKNEPATLTITKLDKDTNEKLTGAEFTLMKGTDTPLTAKDNGDGTYTISGINKAGNWTLVEKKAPNGYKKADVNQTITVKKNTTVQLVEVTEGETTVKKYQTVNTYTIDGNAATGVTIENEKDWDTEIVNKATVTVTKYNDDKSVKLAGAVFALTDSEGNVVDTKTTGADGTCKFENLTEGTYTLSEVTAPEGYIKSEKTVEIKVNADSETKINSNNKFQTTVTYTATPNAATFYNTNVTVNIPVEKKWVNADGITLPVSVTVQLYKNGEVTKKCVALTPDENGKWTAEFAKLPTHDGNTENVYTVKEVGYTTMGEDNEPVYTAGVPAGFTSTDGTAANGYTITNTADWADTYVVNPASLTIVKTDADTGKALSGVEFKLYEEGSTRDTVTTDEDGKATFTGLIENLYFLKETKALDGYKESGAQWNVWVVKDENSVRTVLNTDGKWQKVYDCTVTVNDELVSEIGYSITNVKAPDKYTVDLSIEKTVTKTGGNTKPGNETFVFSAYYLTEDGESKSLDTLSIATTGEGTYEKKWEDLKISANLIDPDGDGSGELWMYVSEVAGDKLGWKYSTNVGKYLVKVTVSNYEVTAITFRDATDEAVLTSADGVEKEIPAKKPAAKLTFVNEFSLTNTPSKPNKPSKPSKPVTSVKTGDAGVAMYAMSGLLSLGGAALFMKKRKDEE